MRVFLTESMGVVVRTETRQIRLNPDSTILHAVGMCGAGPADEDELIRQGYHLVSITAEGSIATFTYEREDDSEDSSHGE